MYDLEDKVFKCWASLFIDTDNREQLFYEDIINIYHTMFNLPKPETPVQDVVEFLAEEFKQQIQLPDCTVSNTDYQMKILIYLSCKPCCPNQETNLERVMLFPPDVQQFIAEVFTEIESLIAAYTNKQEPDCDTSDCRPGDSDVVKKLEESFSTGYQILDTTTPVAEKWKAKYSSLHAQHISNQTDIQELNERLDQSYKDNAILGKEIKDLQRQVSDRNSLVVQLDDYKTANSELAEQVDRAQRTTDKMRSKLDTMRRIEEIEQQLSERETDNERLHRDLANAQLLNTQNQHARQEYRREAQERRKLQVENSTLQTFIEQLTAQNEELKSDRLTPAPHNHNMDTSVEMGPSLADELKCNDNDNTTVLKLKEELEEMSDYGEIKLQNENYRMDEKILQEQIASQIEQITTECNKALGLELQIKYKVEEVTSWREKYEKLAADSENRFEKITHEYRQDVVKTKAGLNEALFVSKKEALDKDTTIKQLQSKLHSLTQTPTATSMLTAAAAAVIPSPSTPVFLRKYRTPRRDRWNTPSAIPRLITPVKRSSVQEFDDKRMAEISKRNQAAPPHLRSTYPIEAQYHSNSLSLDSTGRITTDTATAPNSAHKLSNTTQSHRTATAPEIPQKPTAFEIPANTPPKARRKREIEQREIERKESALRTKKNKENMKTLLQFSPPKSKRRKPK